MHTDVAQEVFDVVKSLPKDAQIKILREARSLAERRSYRPIWERIRELGAQIPKEELAKMPTDSSEQHDHYLYGSSKK